MFNSFDLSKHSSSDGDAFRVFRLQVAILNTHSNGRDTHIRQLKVYSILP